MLSKEEDKVIWAGIGILFIVLLFVYINLFDRKEPLLQSENWEGVPIATTVYFYDNHKQVGEAYARLVDPEDSYQREGFAIWYKGEPECQIHTLRIRHQKDEKRIETLGHEMLHCIIGTWHEEGVRR